MRIQTPVIILDLSWVMSPYAHQRRPSKIALKDIGCNDGKCTDLDEGRVQWQVLILATMEFHELLLQLLRNLVITSKKKKTLNYVMPLNQRRRRNLFRPLVK